MKLNALACRSWRSTALTAAIIGTTTSPAFAQLDKVATTMTTIQVMLVSISVITLTIAIMWAGYKMIFDHARWTDISNILIGGILIGGATSIAAWLAGP